MFQLSKVHNKLLNVSLQLSSLLLLLMKHFTVFLCQTFIGAKNKSGDRKLETFIECP